MGTIYGDGLNTGGKFDFSGANVTVNDLAPGIFAWDANGQLIGTPIPELGEVITWDNKSWQVQHYDGNGYVYLALSTLPSKTEFGDNTTYSGSTLASVASAYQSNNMSSAALAQCQDVTVNGVTAKVFIPSYKMMSGTASASGFDANDPTWDWPSAAAANRICQYDGKDAGYWTSSTHDNSTYVWYTNMYGSFTGSGPMYPIGFRPAIKIPVQSIML